MKQNFIKCNAIWQNYLQFFPVFRGKSYIFLLHAPKKTCIHIYKGGDFTLRQSNVVFILVGFLTIYGSECTELCYCDRRIITYLINLLKRLPWITLESRVVLLQYVNKYLNRKKYPESQMSVALSITGETIQERKKIISSSIYRFLEVKS